ncbi:MAG: hypothetical protein R6V77_02825 [Candidatus Cloacimonadaceae bacterium]
MKTSTWISVILAVIAFVFSVLWFTTNTKKVNLAKQMDSLKTSFEFATETINDIQTNLDSIEIGLSGQLFSGREMPISAADRRSQIISTVRSMKQQIEYDKERITTLEKQLAGSQVKNRSLESMIAKLRQSINDKERIVAELSGKLGILEETVISEKILSQEEISKRDREIAAKVATIKTQEKDLNTIFYAYGSRKELVDTDVITREGGILGLGKVSTLSKMSELEKYKTFNLDEVEGISFPATKRGYSILSSQNAASYRVDKVGDSYVLKVTNKELFRKYKILVIEIL